VRHPLQPVLVHFPIACWSLATVADIASPWWGEPAWRLAGMLLVVGTVTAIAAMATGFVELMKVRNDSPAIGDIHRHMSLVVGAWTLYAASLFLRLHGTTLTRPGAVDIALSVGGFLLLCAGAWFGGKLVYGYRLGVTTGPQP